MVTNQNPSAASPQQRTTEQEVSLHCLRGEPYRGFTSRWFGDGSVVFRNADHIEIKGNSNLRYPDNWMNEAWLMAKDKIDAAVEGVEPRLRRPVAANL